MTYECTNCHIKFPTVNAYHAHATDCKIKYKNKPRYKIVDITERGDMPNRLHERGRKLVYDFLVERDGEHCIHCKIVPGTGPPLEIDHMNNDPNDWNPENLHLLCKTCNLQFRQLSTDEHVLLIQKDSALNVCVCEKKKGNPGTQTCKLLVDYTQGSPEMQVNKNCEGKFRDWILTEIDGIGFISKDDCVYSGAEYCGCSPATVERYLKKLTSLVGPLEISNSEYNKTVVKRRHS